VDFEISNGSTFCVPRAAVNTYHNSVYECGTRHKKSSPIAKLEFHAWQNGFPELLNWDFAINLICSIAVSSGRLYAQWTNPGQIIQKLTASVGPVQKSISIPAGLVVRD
jgi:hypothetical protein